MNEITILIWITIAIICVIACILVKLHYKSDELEHDEGSIIPSAKSINEKASQKKEKIDSSTFSNSLSSKSTQNTKSLYGSQQRTPENYGGYIVPEVNNNPTYEYESKNQVLIDYGNEVKKFQEPIKQIQRDIINQNKNDKTELKDLFTIDELIKESKRKDSEREKEQPKEEDSELTELKETIIKKQEKSVEESSNDEVETIGSLLNEKKDSEDETSTEIETPSKSQKTIEEAISSAYQEKEENESISEDKNITDVLLNAEEDNNQLDTTEEIKEPTLKTPTKITETEDDESDLSEDNEQIMDLDYRKDLDKFTKKIKGSKLFQEVKEKLTVEPEYLEENIPEEENYIRNVREYDEFEPIINETHSDYIDPIEDIEPAFVDNELKSENEPKTLKVIRDTPKPDNTQLKTSTIKSKPSRNNIKIKINNDEFVLKKGDEIIFNHLGETYSSQVYAINGDDISVKYRRQNIIIKPTDVKKIY